MIRSMTGFGRYEVSEDNRKFTVEMKSVNHRYLDVSIKMPKKLMMFEPAIRTLLKDYVQRGKVDVYVCLEEDAENQLSIRCNRAAAAQYLHYLKELAGELSLENDIRVSALSRYPEVFTLEEQAIDEEGLWRSLEKAVRGAAEGFVGARSREGAHLRQDMLEKLEGMLRQTSFIEEKSPRLAADYRRKLESRVRELLEDVKVDESRLLMEVTLFADKSCVDEELVRLRSHIEAVRNALLEGGSQGRRLDFIAQEMNREANTILSKSGDLEISACAIELKTEIEKIREQIQNLE